MTTYSRALPEAMGYTVTMFETNMLVGRDGTMQTWNPRDDSAQCFEVLCWFLSGDVFREVNRADVWPAISQGEIQHTNTPASLRAAIVEAAERVADANGEE